MGQAAPTAARRTRLGRQVPWKSQRCPRTAPTSLWTAPTLNGRNCSPAPSTIHCARAALRLQVVENSALLSPSLASLHAAPANCRCTPLRASSKIADGTLTTNASSQALAVTSSAEDQRAISRHAALAVARTSDTLFLAKDILHRTNATESIPSAQFL